MDLRRKKSSPLSSLLIDGRTIEIVQHFKFLGSTIPNNLKREPNIDTSVRGIAAALLSKKVEIMLTFYRAAIESVLTFSITVWFRSITVKEKFGLDRVKTASRIIGRDLTSLESLD